MGTLRSAEAARDKHAEKLRRLGAHAIEVAEVRRQRRKEYVVVAFFAEQPRRRVPSSLEIGSTGRGATVELVVKIAPPFGPG